MYGRPLCGLRPFPSSSSLGWFRRHASLSSSRRRFLSRFDSSRRLSSASLAFLLSLLWRSRSARRSVTGPSFAITAGRSAPPRRPRPSVACLHPAGLRSKGPHPVFSIYDVYDVSISFNSITRRVDVVPSGLTIRSWRSSKARRPAPLPPPAPSCRTRSRGSACGEFPVTTLRRFNVFLWKASKRGGSSTRPPPP